jgi:hypothetical protein
MNNENLRIFLEGKIALILSAHEVHFQQNTAKQWIFFAIIDSNTVNRKLFSRPFFTALQQNL